MVKQIREATDNDPDAVKALTRLVGKPHPSPSERKGKEFSLTSPLIGLIDGFSIPLEGVFLGCGRMTANPGLYPKIDQPKGG
jgi:hypothetical protein